LNTFLVEPFIQRYNIVSLRVLLDDSKEVWLKRRNLENAISKEEGVVAFFTALTLMQQKSGKEDQDSDEEEEDNNKKDSYGFSFCPFAGVLL